MYQAAVVVRDALGEDVPWADYRGGPRVTFTPRGGLGGAEREGVRATPGLDVAVSTGDLGRPRLAGQGAGRDQAGGRTASAASSSAAASRPSGGEILSMLEAAVHAEIPVATLLTMHFAYPTYHRPSSTRSTSST
jgi:hypothetical protein